MFQMSVLRGGSPLNGRQGFGHCRAALRRPRSDRPGSCLLSRPRIPSLGSAGRANCGHDMLDIAPGRAIWARARRREASRRGEQQPWCLSGLEEVERSRREESPGLGLSVVPRFSASLCFSLSLSTTCIQLGLINLNSSNGVPVEVHRLPVEMAAQHRPGSADCGRVAPPRNRRPVCRL